MTIFVPTTIHYPSMDKDINSIKVVYQRLSASDGDVSTNSEVVGGRIERISE